MCLCFCFSTLSSSFSGVRAIDGSDNDVIYEYDEQGNVVAEIYTYHEDYDRQTWWGPPEGIYDPDRGPAMYAASKSNFSWSPSSIPWASFPSYINAIAYSPYMNFSWTDPNSSGLNASTYRAPFILVTSNGTNYTIRAGWDVSLYYRASTGNCTVGYNATTKSNLKPVLYMATFKCSDNSVVSAWSEVAAEAWGSAGRVYYYPNTAVVLSNKLDVFTYGVNTYITQANAVLVNEKYSDTENVVIAPNNTGRGMADHSYYGFPAAAYNAATNLYIKSFTPADPTTNTITASTNFGVNNAILTGDSFLFRENLPYGSNSLVFGFTLNGLHTYHFITDSSSEVIFLRNWDWNTIGKFRVAFLSKSPIYRVGYNGNSGAYASVNGYSGLIESDTSSTFTKGSTSWHYIIDYYIKQGYRFYNYALPEGSVSITISNNYGNLITDNTLSFSQSFSAYPSVDSKSQLLLEQQNQTSNSIWQTLKDVLTYVSNLPTNIANSIKGFFTNLGDRISSFFTSIGDRINGFFTSIGDRISGFFTNLINSIKDFFLPSDGFFSTYAQSFQDFFSDRLGILYELPESVVDIFQQLVDYNPAQSGYSIHFPEVVLPVLDNGEWYDRVIIEETDITFDFLEQGAFATLYSLYRSVIWMIFIFALINLIIRKSERVFGGSG